MNMRTIYLSLWACLLVGCSQSHRVVGFEKSRIGNVTYEAASAFDVDKDGHIDIVSGEYWFAGPDFKSQHKICTVAPNEDYFNDFADIPLDVDGDGYLDIVTGGWWEATLKWRQNPKGKPIEWEVHDIEKCGNIETIRAWDIDGDGQVEVVPNLPGNSLYVYKLVTDSAGKGTGKFSKHLIRPEKQGHGLGFGDINGDGRGDFIISTGWLESPKEPLRNKWTWHPEFNLGTASIPILVYDVNRDRLPDLIVGQAHDYGLFWMEQRQRDGKRTWVRHDIDPNRSQYHDLQMQDIDNDGKSELITGKRYRAHQELDPGSLDPIGIYYFEIDGGGFDRVTIDYGPANQASGAGIYFWAADLDGNGYKDIIAPGKQGLYLFRNRGPNK